MNQWFPTILGMVVLAGQAVASPRVIDDAKLMEAMSKELGAMVEMKQATAGETLAKFSKNAPMSMAVELPGKLPPVTRYEDLVKSVYLIGSAGKCGHCTKWHVGNTATAWCLTSDGLMITNHHVFAKASGSSWGVCSVDGKVFRVLEVLATNEAADVALFRVDAKGLVPLALGVDSEVGDKVSIISHPDRRCYFHTTGEVARYMSTPARPSIKETIWMSVTADFAKGSSGGPVLNADGAVVGMVANTQSIYYGVPHPEERAKPIKNSKEGKEGKEGKEIKEVKPAPDQGPLQMVIKNCVPVAALRAITTAPVVVPK